MAGHRSRQSEVQREERRRNFWKRSADVQLPTPSAYAQGQKSTSVFQRKEINSQARRLERISNRDVTHESCVLGERSGVGDFERGHHLILCPGTQFAGATSSPSSCAEYPLRVRARLATGSVKHAAVGGVVHQVDAHPRRDADHRGVFDGANPAAVSHTGELGHHGV